MTASLENCKKLYRLSGWKDPLYAWEETKTNGVCLINTTYDRATTGGTRTPAYDSGYLLRKLPLVELKHIALNSDDPYRWSCNTSMFVEGWVGPLVIKADTPENCLALLAIKLFEEAVL